MRLTDCAFLADENINPAVAAFLRAEGRDVLTVEDCELRGADDLALIRYGVQERRVILTHDSDFGYLAVAADEPIFGIVYLRPGHIDPQYTIDTLKTLFEMDLEVTVPFIVVAVRRDGLVRVRLRQLSVEDVPAD